MGRAFFAHATVPELNEWFVCGGRRLIWQGDLMALGQDRPEAGQAGFSSSTPLGDAGGLAVVTPAEAVHRVALSAMTTISDQLHGAAGWPRMSRVAQRALRRWSSMRAPDSRPSFAAGGGRRSSASAPSGRPWPWNTRHACRGRAGDRFVVGYVGQGGVAGGFLPDAPGAQLPVGVNDGLSEGVSAGAW